MVTSAFSSTLVHLSVMMMIIASRLGILLYMMIPLKLKNVQTKAGFSESNCHSFSLIVLKMVSFYFVFCFSFTHFRIGSHRLLVMSTDLNSHHEYNGSMSLRYIFIYLQNPVLLISCIQVLPHSLCFCSLSFKKKIGSIIKISDSLSCHGEPWKDCRHILKNVNTSRRESKR